MDKSKSRKEHNRRRFTCDSVEFSSLERGRTNNERNKYKKHSKEKNTYEVSPNSYVNNWPTHARQHPFAHRPISDSAICHYSVPLSLSFEPVSLPIYSAIVQPQRNCAPPLEFDSHLHKSKYNRIYSQNKKNRNNSAQNEVPAIFHTPRILSGDQQDYTSLPPVNCNLFAPKSSDTVGAFKRRFSDPGVGQISSDDCTSSGSESCDSLVTPDAQPHDFLALVEQVNELKENNNHLQRELNETKLELETLKMQFQCGTNGCEPMMPGALSDAINEIRNAVKLGEEALTSKVIKMLEKNSAEWKEVQAKLEEKLSQDMYKKLSKLEEKLTKICQSDGNESANPIQEEPFDENDLIDFSVHQQLLELEQEKRQLQKDLQEAVSKRRTAETTTEKLEKLVGILWKKINGVSLESCLTDEKHIVVRPLSSGLEKNLFAVANNKQKVESPSFQKPKIPSIIKAFTQENSESNESIRANENKENESVEYKSTQNGGNAGSGSTLSSTSDPNLLTAQVTITGPVTDL